MDYSGAGLAGGGLGSDCEERHGGFIIERLLWWIRNTPPKADAPGGCRKLRNYEIQNCGLVCQSLSGILSLSSFSGLFTILFLFAKIINPVYNIDSIFLNPIDRAPSPHRRRRGMRCRCTNMQKNQKYNLIATLVFLTVAGSGLLFLWPAIAGFVRGNNNREVNKIATVPFSQFENKDTIVEIEPTKVVIETKPVIPTDNTTIKPSNNTVVDKPNAPVIQDASSAISSIPPKFNLAVPFVPQAPEKNWDQPWQDACEEAAVLMLDAYYRGYNVSIPFIKAELVKMISWEENQGWGLSIEMEKMKILTEWYMGLKNGNNEEIGNKEIRNWKLEIVENPTIEQLKKFIANGQPVLVVADGKALPNPHFQNGGPEYHALIIRGYTEDKFITNDPGTQYGENFTYKYNDLMNAIHDWNDGDVPNGRRVVMVVE